MSVHSSSPSEPKRNLEMSVESDVKALNEKKKAEKSAPAGVSHRDNASPGMDDDAKRSFEGRSSALHQPLERRRRLEDSVGRRQRSEESDLQEEASVLRGKRKRTRRNDRSSRQAVVGGWEEQQQERHRDSADGKSERKQRQRKGLGSLDRAWSVASSEGRDGRRSRRRSTARRGGA